MLRDGRYSYGPPPSALTYTRLPGYPLAAALFDWKPRLHDDHVRRAAIANAVFDTLTAIILAVWLSEMQVCFIAVMLCIVAMSLSPLSILYSVHALSESLATLLLVVQLFMIHKIGKRGSVLFSILSGVTLGVSQMVRFDSVVILLVAMFAIFLSPGTWRHSAKLFVAYLTSAMVLFSPWPIRNLIRFGSPHLEGTEWLAQDGASLPTGPIRWMRTWCSSAPGESLFADLLVFGRAFNSSTPGVLVPQMYDSTHERKILARLIDRLGSNRNDVGANNEFIKLADERTRTSPLRTLIHLPAKRLKKLLLPPDSRSIRWVKIPVIGWPASFVIFPLFYVVSYLFAMIGIVWLVLRRDRLLLGLFLLPISARLALYSIAVPHQAGPRYVVEIVPLVIVLAVFGIAFSVRQILKLCKYLNTLRG